MKKRVITATILCCVLLPVLFFGSYFMIALTMFLSFMGVYELVKMYNNKHSIANGYKITLPIITSLITGVISFGFYFDTKVILYIALPILVVVLLILLITAMFDKSINMTDMFTMVGFMLYGGLSFPTSRRARNLPESGLPARRSVRAYQGARLQEERRRGRWPNIR